jgi:hypothetical protein
MDLVWSTMGMFFILKKYVNGGVKSQMHLLLEKGSTIIFSSNFDFPYQYKRHDRNGLLIPRMHSSINSSEYIGLCICELGVCIFVSFFLQFFNLDFGTASIVGIFRFPFYSKHAY